jgi:hypothetical protein
VLEEGEVTLVGTLVLADGGFTVVGVVPLAGNIAPVGTGAGARRVVGAGVLEIPQVDPVGHTRDGLPPNILQAAEGTV